MLALSVLALASGLIFYLELASRSGPFGRIRQRMLAPCRINPDLGRNLTEPSAVLFGIFVIFIAMIVVADLVRAFG